MATILGFAVFMIKVCSQNAVKTHHAHDFLTNIYLIITHLYCVDSKLIEKDDNTSFTVNDNTIHKITP